MKKHVWLALAIVGGMIVLSATLFVYDVPAVIETKILGSGINKLEAATLFVIVMLTATIVAPVTILPLVPMIAPLFGAFQTGLLSVIGWTLGAIVAFLVARHAGRPLLERFVSIESFRKIEEVIPAQSHFLFIVMLRILLPVDMLSYALGLFSSVNLLTYTIATLIGVSWFSFAFSYLGSTAYQNDAVAFLGIGVVSLGILALSAVYVVQNVNAKDRK